MAAFTGRFYKLSTPAGGTIERMVKNGVASNKAAVVRRAIEKLAEDEAVNAVLLAEREMGEGKFLRGDIRELMKKIK